MSELWTKRKISNRLHKYCNDNSFVPNVATLVDLCEFPIQIVSNGAYRVVYNVIGTEFIIKMPIEATSISFDTMGTKGQSACKLTSKERSYQSNLEHARDEWAAYCDIMWGRRNGKRDAIRPLMPEMYTFFWRTGVLLMKRYQLLSRRNFHLRREVANTVADALGDGNCDYDIDNCGNVGKDIDTGRIVLLDIGLLPHDK
jgi:hypothetical protein